MMFLDMSTCTKKGVTIFAIFLCCFIPKFECCDPGEKMTLEEKVDGSNIIVLGTVLRHYEETRDNMFTAEVQVKCILKDCGISVHNVVNISHAGKDSGGQCFDTTLTINNTYYIFSRILTPTFWRPAAEEIPEASSDVTKLLTTCGLSATGPGPAIFCSGVKFKACPTTTQRPISTRRPKSPKASGTTATVVELTSSSTSGKKGTTATVVELTSSSTSGKKVVKEKSTDNELGAILGGVLGPLTAGGVAATIYYYVKNTKNKKVSDTEPQRDKIMEDDHISEVPMSKPPMVMDEIPISNSPESTTL